MLTCRGFAERASLVADGMLPPAERPGVRFHLLICPHCRRLLRQLRGVIGAVAGRAAQKNAAPIDADFADRLVAAMVAAPATGPATTPSPRGDGPPPRG